MIFRNLVVKNKDFNFFNPTVHGLFWGSLYMGGARRAPPIFSEKIIERGGFWSDIHLSISKLSLHANFQTFSTLCSGYRAITMIFDFAEFKFKNTA